MKTIEKKRLEKSVENILAELPLYEFIMSSFNLILNPEYWGKRNGIVGLDENSIRLVVLKALKEDFGEELSTANTEAEKALKKACNYIPGLFEVVKLRLLLFYIPEEDINKILFLLDSDEESKEFGGLRTLRLNPHQAKVLLPVAKEIGLCVYEINSNFPERAIKEFLETTTNEKISRIEGLLSNGDDRCIHGGLMELQLAKPQQEYCKKMGIDPILKLISEEKLKRDNAELLEKFNEACQKLQDANLRLQSAGFEHSEIQEMLKCTKAYAEYVKCKKALAPELLKAIA